jgi:hypothetical protein
MNGADSHYKLTGRRFFHQTGPVIGGCDEFFDSADFGSRQTTAGFHVSTSQQFDSHEIHAFLLKTINHIFQARREHFQTWV